MSALRAWTVALCLFGLPLFTTIQAGAEDERNFTQVVTGTLVKLDLTSHKGIVRTDLGKPIFFNVSKPHLFEHLSVGQRVTMELDGFGRANKVIDASITEFLPEAPEELNTESPQPVG